MAAGTVILKQGANQEREKCFSTMCLGIRENGVGYAGTLSVIIATLL